LIKKLGILLLFICFAFAVEDTNNTVGKKDKAEVKKIEQNIMQEKQQEAQKLEEEKKLQE